MGCKLCDVSYVVLSMWRKLCGANYVVPIYVVQIICKLRGVSYVDQNVPRTL